MNVIMASHRHPARPLGEMDMLRMAAIFWLFSYAIQSFWVKLIVEDAFAFLSWRRSIAVTAGALIYWVVLRRIVGSDTDGRSTRWAILASIVPAAVGVLAVRMIVDALFFERPLPQSINLQWVLVWTGYFGLWVSGALAFKLQRGFPLAAPRRGSLATARPAAAPAPSSVTGRAAAPAPAPDDAWDWVVDVLAEEAAALADGDRKALADRLVDRAGYSLADPGDGSAAAHNARVDLAYRIAARLDAGSRG